MFREEQEKSGNENGKNIEFDEDLCFVQPKFKIKHLLFK
jgi:hypothetical protein